MSIACDICYEFYSDKQARVPRLLPRCGHDYCTQCVANLCSVEVPRCPKCRVNVFSNNNTRSGGDGCGGPQHSSSRGGPADCPVLRCLLELEDRIDLRNGDSPIIIQKAVQCAAMEVLQVELNLRQQLQLLQSVPLEILREEIDYRSELQRRKSRDGCSGGSSEINAAAESSQEFSRCSALDAFAQQALARAQRATSRASRFAADNSSVKSTESGESSGTAESCMTRSDSSNGEESGMFFVPRESAPWRSYWRVHSSMWQRNGSARRSGFNVGTGLSFESFAASAAFRLLDVFHRLSVGNMKYLLHQWCSIPYDQRLQVLMVVQALPLLAVAIYVNFASLF